MLWNDVDYLFCLYLYTTKLDVVALNKKAYSFFGVYLTSSILIDLQACTLIMFLRFVLLTDKIQITFDPLFWS